MTPFDAAVALVIELEGGEALVEDRGGLTRWGISSRANPDVNVRTLTRDQAVAIYRERYWRAVRGDELPPGLALVVFDAAVNQGAPTACRMLQAALGVTGDGVIGPVTLAAAKLRATPATIRAMTVRRLRRYAEAPDFRINGTGWFDRALRVFAEGLRL